MQLQNNKQKFQGFIEDEDFIIKKAGRTSIKVKLALTGPSGSGKTLGALLVAYGLCPDWSKIGFLDTENESANYYVGRDFDYSTRDGIQRISIGGFNHLPLADSHYDKQKYPQGPYHPRRFVAAMKALLKKCPQTEVIIVDSGTHEWEGLGGILDIQSKLGGQYADWAKVNPLHKEFIDCIRDLPIHVIMTMRSKSDVIVEMNAKGKFAPKKIGTKSVQREGTDYEFGIVFDINMDHRALASKDRTGIFAPADIPFQLTPAIGTTIAEWAKDGIVEEPIRNKEEQEIDPTNISVTQRTKGILWRQLQIAIKMGIIEEQYSVSRMHNIPDGLTEAKCLELIDLVNNGNYTFFIKPEEKAQQEDELQNFDNFNQAIEKLVEPD